MLKTKKYFFFQFSGEIIDHKSMQPVETRLLRYFILALSELTLITQKHSKNISCVCINMDWFVKDIVQLTVIQYFSVISTWLLRKIYVNTRLGITLKFKFSQGHRRSPWVPQVVCWHQHFYHMTSQYGNIQGNDV